LSGTKNTDFYLGATFSAELLNYIFVGNFLSSHSFAFDFHDSVAALDTEFFGWATSDRSHNHDRVALDVKFYTDSVEISFKLFGNVF
jgi:hypothetical protein